MPKDKKGKKAQAAAAAAAANAAPACDDDNASIASDRTESTVQITDDEGLSEMETYEEKVREAMDLALEKSVQTRTNALTSLTTALQKRVLTHFLLDQYQTLTDLVERSLKKGRGSEQVAAARLATMLVISLSSQPEAEEIYKVLQPTLTVLVMDPSASPAARQESASTLAITAFLACHDLADVTSAMNTLHTLFAASLPKGNGELPTHTPAVYAMHTAALAGFCLLLSLLSPTTVYTMATRLLKEMFELLGCADVELRIQAGEAVALLYESARLHDEDFYWAMEGQLCSVLKELATDSHKFRGKKERKQQRASFRDVLKTVEECEVAGDTMTVGPQHARQDLFLDTWALKGHYQCLCLGIGQGLSVHITLNPGVRDIFNLGPPPLMVDLSGASGKKGQKKNNHETPECKARQLARNKNRDNRQAAKSYDD